MLKEQITQLLIEPDIGCCDWEIGKWQLANWKAGLPDRILNLFKAEADKLSVIDDEGIDLRKWVEDRTGNIDLFIYSKGVLLDLGDKFKEAQLQHTKKQLLDLMEK